MSRECEDCRVEAGSQAATQLAGLNSAIGPSMERRIVWLAENADQMVHRRLVGMPEDLAGLCKLRIGDYRILYRLLGILVAGYRFTHVHFRAFARDSSQMTSGWLGTTG